MPRRKNRNTANTVSILTSKTIQHTNLDMTEPFFSSNTGVRHFLAVSHWCEKADLMTAGSCEADRGGPQGLLRRGRGPTGSAAILNKSGKKLKKWLMQKHQQFRITKRRCLNLMLRIVKMKKTLVHSFERALLNMNVKGTTSQELLLQAIQYEENR
jgi:hypothetical protein